MEKNRESRNKSTQIAQLIINKEAKAIQWRSDSLFNKWCCDS